ncbi:50S ribosomal protein L9 [Mariniphaga sp.]|uniref:50S ribosomal protein L9 n=1 Tax=Mariniphaga sp. TaxID=1954475 RepID=UPI0035645396
MEIILIQDVERLGSKDDVVNVKDGFARNFLIPQKKAVAATSSAKKVLAENIKQRAHKETRLREEAQKIAEKLANKKVKIGAKVSSAGKIFGSVNTIQVAEAINKKGFEIDRKQITLPADSIKEVGSYIAKIKLFKDVIVELEFDVVGE